MLSQTSYKQSFVEVQGVGMHPDPYGYAGQENAGFNQSQLTLLTNVILNTVTPMVVQALTQRKAPTFFVAHNNRHD